MPHFKIRYHQKSAAFQSASTLLAVPQIPMPISILAQIASACGTTTSDLSSSGNNGCSRKTVTFQEYKKAMKFLIITIIIAFSISPSALGGMSGTWPRCVGSCTANDISGLTVYMVQNGAVFNILSDITFGTSGNRYNLHIVYDLYDGSTPIVTNAVTCLNGNGCVSPNPSTNIATGILVGTYSLVPGHTYSLQNVLFIYDTSTQPCTCKDGDCSVFPPSKCKQLTGTISICPAPVLSTQNYGVCQGNSVQIGVSASPSGSYSYSWTPATGLSSTTVQNPIATPAMTTTYTVTVTNTVCKSSSTASVVVTVYNPPTAAFSGSPVIGCSPLAVTFTDASTAPSGETITKWEWDFNNDSTIDRTDTSAPAPFVYTYSSPGTYSVSLRVTTNKGCINTVVKTNYITVNAVPSCAITAPSSVCESTSSLHASVPAFTGATYSWTVTGDGSAVSGANTQTLTWKSNAYSTGTVRLSVTVTGPSLTYCSCTSSVYIPVLANPTASAGSAQTVCAGSTVQLAGSASNYSTVTWSGGSGTFSPNANTLNAVYTPTSSEVNAGTVTLTLTAAPKSPCATSTTSNVVITIQARPTANFTASSTSICTQAPVTFSDASNGNGRTITAWAWDFGDGTTYNGQTPPAHTYSSPGTYTVELTVTSACGSNTMTKTGYITAYGPPTANFTAIPNSGCPPLTVTFSDTSNGNGRTITSWTWDFGDGNTYIGQTPLAHIFSNKGTYAVKLTVTSACGSNAKTAYVTVSQPVVVPGTYGPACVSSSNITLGGSPGGGTWFGDGVSGKIFNPAVAGPGNHVLTYQYTSGGSCSFSNTTSLTVVPLPQTTITVG